eukprot:PhF_6_TR40583/c0_g1_i1/m.60855
MSVYILTFVVCTVICVIFNVLLNKKSNPHTSGASSSSNTLSTDSEDRDILTSMNKMHKIYLLVYSLATFSDWLKGPYVYALYQQYGYGPSEISFLFICGFISSLVFGTITAAVSDHYGRRRMCITYAFVYILSALSKLSPNYMILILGRVLSGVATSLLFCSFEAWVASEHKARGYPSHYLAKLFSQSIVVNGVAAISAGLLSQAVVTYTGLGFVGPFLLAVPCLVMQALVVSVMWTENYGTQGSTSPLASIYNGFVAIRRSKGHLFLGLSQALFEGSMYVFVFLWTPTVTPKGKGTTLDPADIPPYGLIFACFMVCIMIGGAAFGLLTSASSSNSSMDGTSPTSNSDMSDDSHGAAAVVIVESLPNVIHSSAAGCFLVIAFSLAYDQDGGAPVTSYLTFLLYEVTVGVMYPAYATIRSTHLSDETRAAVMSLFRVPLNLLVIVFLTCGARLELGQAYCMLGGINILGLYCYRKFLLTLTTGVPV